MRRYGFSTGALAHGDFGRALGLLKHVHVDAVELSALRPAELLPLVRFVSKADLSRFSFISVHAPTGFSPSDEPAIVRHLRGFSERGWPIVVHPDAIYRFTLWTEIGDNLLVENMDRRKPVGRTAHELAGIFSDLAEAGMCFDIAHARQFDTSMTEAYKILRQHGDRIRQVHISEVNTSSKHDRISPTAVRAYQDVSGLVPPDAPIILETPAEGDQIEEQLGLAAAVFNSPKADQVRARSLSQRGR